MAYPTDFKYTKEHEWIKADGKNATIGITNYAQESLGDIVFVELPKVGSEITAGKTFGTVESVKAVSDLYAPATGTVNEVNGELATAPEKLLCPVTVKFMAVAFKDASLTVAENRFGVSIVLAPVI